MSIQIRCGTKLYNGIPIPQHSTVKISPLERLFYISGIELPNTAIIRFISPENEIKRIPLDKALKCKNAP